jgi:hypothetical protein
VKRENHRRNMYKKPLTKEQRSQLPSAGALVDAKGGLQ